MIFCSFLFWYYDDVRLVKNMIYEEDTIAAIASGCTDSGIGVIRLSGKYALSIIEKVFVPKKEGVKLSEMKSYTAHYGFIVNPLDKNKIDECIILYMKGPHSYTGEDVVEIDAHGGNFVCKRILRILLENGARLAEPGEYTKRAFLNGRMDLTQAEAVMDVIHADNEYALKISMNQLSGKLKDKIISIRNQIIHKNAYIEYALDDPEHVSLDGFSDKLLLLVNDMIEDINELLRHADDGKLLKEGIKTAIVGRPNAGKSSLLNALLREERAIVTDIPGTTRDTLEEHITIEGIPFHIIDTAGIHDTEDIVEKIGVDKAKNVIINADLILYIIDSSNEFKEEDEKIIELIKDKNVIVLLNKSDLEQKMDENRIKNMLNAPILSISIKKEEGLKEFYDIIKEMFFHGEITVKEGAMISNERQRLEISNALESLMKVKESIELSMSEDFYTIDLMDAYEYLGNVIGESVHDDLVNQIFEEFCTGK